VPAGQRARRSRRVPARAFELDLPGGRRLDPVKAARIDVQPAEARSAIEERSACAPVSSRRKRRQRYERRGARSRKSCRALPPPRASAGAAAATYRSRRRAVKHAAVGGRMTARWSGVSHERRPDGLDRGGSRSLAPAGFPTALGGQSPKKVFSRRVLVSETSVVETDSKHPGGASKESREASRGAHRLATGSREARTGPIVIYFAQRCHGLQDAERRRVSPRRIRPADSWSLRRASAAGPPAVD